MSHVTCSEVTITDIECLEAAVARMPELKFIRGKKTYRWWGNWLNDWHNNPRQANRRGIDPDQFGKCDHAISVKNADEGYQIGVTKCKDGTGWKIVWDDIHAGSDSSISTAIGRNGQKLMSLYAEEVCKKYAAETGAHMETTELEDGNLRIELIQV